MIYYSEEIGKQLQNSFDFPIHPIHILKWGQHFWLQTARFIPDAI